MSLSSGDARAPRPNILVITLDDVGVDKIGIYGAPAGSPPTPTLDALARRGVLFENAYTNPVCSPTRVAMLTGRYAWRTGAGAVVGAPGSGPGDFLPSADEVTLPELLAPAGYRNWAVGKWHMANATWPGGRNNHPVQWGGFDLHAGTIANVSSAAFSDSDWFDWPKNVADENGFQVVPTRAYATSETVDDALALINTPSEQPFFMWLAFNAPHKPFHAPPSELHTQGPLCEGACGAVDKYAAALQALDTELGRLFASMRPTVAKRTTVIVLGDNGTPPEAVNQAGLSQKSKGSVFQGGIRVPMIVWGSAVANGGRVHTGMVDAVDVFSTVLHIARLRVPNDGVARDSQSIYPAIANLPTSDRAWSYAERFEPNGFDAPKTLHRRAAQNSAGWKLHHYPRVGPPAKLQLYYLPDDPHETNNRYPPSTPAEEAAAAELLAVLELNGS
ncbi:MAG: hypothetical protein DHS20C15_19610 [Planctomycetota bacterium]|nr:MAG: hypothetical protein DHS20C15_19610 [Planctomycetota bacterium]